MLHIANMMLHIYNFIYDIELFDNRFYIRIEVETAWYSHKKLKNACKIW